jgi:2-keto-4-pentenoate hydratase/2-oxohepta-3-ene-1,7-dioic acid hydratase in catechol pathway
LTLPFARPGKIVGVGRNYARHAAELGNPLPEEPILFLKPPSSLIGPGEPIVLPRAAARVEHEAEIAVVVGARLRAVDPDAAARAIGGITAANDVTARDLQKRDGQWTRAKGFDSFCPVGPVVKHIAPERLGELVVRCRVNGEVRQEGWSGDMAFPIPWLVAWISHVMTLEPGDLVLTGTPEGVGPLAPGDVVEVEVHGVGVLRNPVVATGG